MTVLGVALYNGSGMDESVLISEGSIYRVVKYIFGAAKYIVLPWFHYSSCTYIYVYVVCTCASLALYTGIIERRPRYEANN